MISWNKQGDPVRRFNTIPLEEAFNKSERIKVNKATLRRFPNETLGAVNYNFGLSWKIPYLYTELCIQVKL